ERVWRMRYALFGIQARGAASCAGPYGHRLLGIAPDRSSALSELAGRGFMGIKPGWGRLSLNYFIGGAAARFPGRAADPVPAPRPRRPPPGSPRRPWGRAAATGPAAPTGSTRAAATGAIGTRPPTRGCPSPA